MLDITLHKGIYLLKKGKDTLSKTNIFYVEYNDEVRKVHVKKPITEKDTIDLGIIYFEDLEDLENFDDEEP